MPSANKTANYSLNQWQGNEYPKREDFNSDNTIIDSELKNVNDKAEEKIGKSLATAASQFLVSSAVGEWVVKTIAEIKTLLGLGSAAYTASTDYATAAQGETADETATALSSHQSDYTLQIPYGGTSTNVGNAYSIASPVIDALVTGWGISFKCNADSTGASTLNWDGKGAKGIKKANGTDVTNLKANGIYTLRYDGTNFILQGEGGSGNAIASDLALGKTASTDAGDIVGTSNNSLSAGDDYIHQNAVLVGTTSTSFVKQREVEMKKGGVVRVKFGIRAQTAGYPSYGQIYKNDIAVGIVRTNASSTLTYYTEDVTININDKISIYIHCASGYSALLDYFAIGILGNNIATKLL